MKIKKILYELLYSYKDEKRVQSILTDNRYEYDKNVAMIIRLVHSIEKGLSIENPRMGFGFTKITQLIKLVERNRSILGQDSEVNLMARDAIASYILFHKNNNYQDDNLISLINRFNVVFPENVEKENAYGGTLVLNKSDLDFSQEEITKFFMTRHSIRQFSGDPVPRELVKEAVKLAQQAPSACNRQAVRVYLVDSKKYINDINSSLDGIGGFTDDVDSFLLITGKLSAYDEYEYKQFIVSASIFAGFLIQTLHAYKIGCCCIQRSNRNTEEWQRYSKINGIPDDEQLVVMLGIGALKESTVVPISKRLNIDTIYRVLE